MTLEKIIKKLKFDWVNSDITEEHFPLKKIRGKVKIFKFGRDVSSEDAIKEMEKEGYEPANAYELLEYAEKDWNGKDWIVALGQTWQDSHGYLRVLVLDSGSGGRGLSFYYFVSRWRRNYVFAGVLQVAKSLDTKTLGSSSELGDLETRVLSLENDINKIKKFLII